MKIAVGRKTDTPHRGLQSLRTSCRAPPSGKNQPGLLTEESAAVTATAVGAMPCPFANGDGPFDITDFNITDFDITNLI